MPYFVSNPDVQVVSVTGSVNVVQSGSFILSGTTTVTGSVGITGPVLANITGTVNVAVQTLPNITGSVNVTNAVLNVTGSVLAYPTGTQTVAGTVTAVITGTLQTTGSVAVNNIVTVTGSVLALPTGTQTVAGTVTAVITGTLQTTGSIAVNNTVAVSGSFGLQDTSGRQVIVGPVPSGSTAQGAPVVVAGIDNAGGVRTLLTDTAGRAFVSASVTGSIAVNNIVVVTGSMSITSLSGSYGGQIEGRSANGSGAISNPVAVAGLSGSTTLTIAVDSLGRIITAPAGSTSPTAGFIYGGVATSGATQIKVEATTYTEMTGSVQRSIVSTSANDTNTAGTGARKVKITYFKSDYSGPYTEIVNLNGTTAVNTTATDICFIERMDVTEVGSNGSNVGTINLKSMTAGNGVTIGSIAVATFVATAGDNQTLWCHHYIASGKTCYITSVTTTHNNNTSLGSGGTFHLKSQLSGANKVDVQVTDFIHQFGQDSSTPRNYGTPITIAGPARLTGYVLPDAALTVNYFFSFDFYEQ